MSSFKYILIKSKVRLTFIWFRSWPALRYELEWFLVLHLQKPKLGLGHRIHPRLIYSASNPPRYWIHPTSNPPRQWIHPGIESNQVLNPPRHRIHSGIKFTWHRIRRGIESTRYRIHLKSNPPKNWIHPGIDSTRHRIHLVSNPPRHWIHLESNPPRHWIHPASNSPGEST